MTSFCQTCEHREHSVKLLLAGFRIGLFILGLNLRRAIDVQLIPILITTLTTSQDKPKIKKAALLQNAAREFAVVQIAKNVLSQKAAGLKPHSHMKPVLIL